MNTLLRPSLALRPQRDGLRHKANAPLRSRAAKTAWTALASSHGSASDCVFKRLPSIGDTCAVPAHA